MRAGGLLRLLGAASLAAAASLKDVPKPKGPLTWGDVNVVHTTDIHGWILGHPKPVFPELNWSGTFGDFSSFLHHMRKKAEEEKRDLFLVDSGDRRIGHGLTDRLMPGTVNGQLVVEMYIFMGYDAVCPGNHDIEHRPVVEWVIKDLKKQWGDRFISSNVRLNTTTGKFDPQNDPRPFYGASHRYWTTDKTKRKIMAYGLTTAGSRIAKDDNGAEMLAIVPLKTVATQKWFLDTLEQEVDVFLIVGHMDPEKPCAEDGWIYLYDAIRKKHPLTPIMMFAGHTHKRACTRFTSAPNHYKRSMLLQSGRYFDTVGWMSTSLDDNKQGGHLKMTRRYLDNNVVTYKFHTGKSTDDEFHTDVGIAMTDRVYGIDRAEGLSQIYGFLKHDYFLDRKEWDPSKPDEESMFNLYLDAVEKVLVKGGNWLFFSNWGTIRGDLYRGEFTLGDFYSISPNDKDRYRTVRVKRSVADLVVKKIQDQNPSKAQCRSGFAPTTLEDSKQMVRPTTSVHSRSLAQVPMGISVNSTAQLTLGLKTWDVCGDAGEDTPYGDGDDVEHNPIPQVSFDQNPPVYFWRKSWKENSISADEEVDLIFPKYAGGKVPKALNEIIGCKPPYDGCKPYTEASLKDYRDDLTQDQLLGLYIRQAMKTIPDGYPMPE
ncbi:hypothetical protein FRC08_017812 [Ceratobasidium sp. 394]|nr:hypothetical protein FRC08_017812 [Ceratobasidium sp. 394]